MADVGGWFGQNLGPIIAALATGGVIVKALDLWASRRGRDASTDVLLSAEARAIASDLRADLERAEAKRERLEAELNTVRNDLAAERGRCADLARRVAELERIVRQAGLHIPGDTPPLGQPAVAPPEVAP